MTMTLIKEQKSMQYKCQQFQYQLHISNNLNGADRKT